MFAFATSMDLIHRGIEEKEVKDWERGRKSF
jgi:hypothetical protein